MKGGLISTFNNGDSKIKKIIALVKEKTKVYVTRLKTKSISKNLKFQPKFHLNGIFESATYQFFRRHGSIIALVIVIMLGNIAAIQQAKAEIAYENDIFAMPKDTVLEIVNEINSFTPVLNENIDNVAELYTDEESNFITQPELPRQLEENFAATEQPRQYVVEKGDTLASIAAKFNLHVASLLEANNIKDEDASKLKIGDALNIPGSDISTSMAWLEKEQKAREEAIKKAQAEAQKKQAKSKKSFSQGRKLASSRITGAADFDGDDSVGMIVPVSHKGITRGLGRGHTGIDYRADIGTPVYAGANGRVIEFTGGWGDGWGISVVLNHGGGVTTRYAHLNSFVVDMGETVSQGQLIGYSGNTGRSTGPHLHFEKRINGRPVFPF